MPIVQLLPIVSVPCDGSLILTHEPSPIKEFSPTVNPLAPTNLTFL